MKSSLTQDQQLPPSPKKRQKKGRNQHNGNACGRSIGKDLKQASSHRPLAPISAMNFFNTRRGTAMQLQCTTGREPRLNPRRRFPSFMVLTLLLLIRLRGRHHPTRRVELGSIETSIDPLDLNILSN